MEKVEPLAYGVLGLKPLELYAMTPREILRAVRGRSDYEEAQLHGQWYRMAWQTAYLLQPYSGKKKLTAEKLLGPKFMAKMKKGSTPAPPKLVTTSVREELDSIREMLATEPGSSHA